MDELEQRLRSAFAGMADDLPQTRFPWAEHHRRLTARNNRRSWQMLAVAAAVVALIAVPVTVLKMRPDPVEAAGSPSTPPTTAGAQPPSSGTKLSTAEGIYRPTGGEKVLTEPTVVLNENVGNVYSRTVAYIVENGTRYLCLAQVQGYETPVVNGMSGSSCTPMNRPRPGKYVWTTYLVHSTQQANQMLYVASPPTESILVRTVEGPYVAAYPLVQGADLSLFRAYLPSNRPPAAYTARDKANVPLEHG